MKKLIEVLKSKLGVAVAAAVVMAAFGMSPALAAGEEATALVSMADIVVSVVACGVAYLAIKTAYIVFPWIGKAIALRS